ncbi:hypothetical protein JRQ81_014447 [Phrynocephalus forsythii]|uniref:Uncharacterized protein n=1 Tax=Phrynocephalus forsythii TaxID=171643 RepID=A0A9Q1B2V1_9SAUR|nr:hypothetical protein JRQ81_014447 [Phrynocephalus forsythii]
MPQDPRQGQRDDGGEVSLEHQSPRGAFQGTAALSDPISVRQPLPDPYLPGPVVDRFRAALGLLPTTGHQLRPLPGLLRWHAMPEALPSPTLAKHTPAPQVPAFHRNACPLPGLLRWHAMPEALPSPTLAQPPPRLRHSSCACLPLECQAGATLLGGPPKKT